MVTPVEAEALGTPEPRKPLLPRNSNVPAAVAWMVGTLLSFSLMAISVRQLGGVLNLFELLTVRAVGGLGILFVVMTAQPALFGHLALRRPWRASRAQRHAFRRQHLLDQRRHPAAARDRVRDRVHDAGVGRAARGAAARRALHAEPRGLDRTRLRRRADHPAARHRGLSTGGTRRARRVARLCGLQHRDQEIDPGAEHDRDPVLDERDADRHGAARYRLRLPAAACLASVDLGVRARLRGHVRALLPDQRAARRRRDRGHPARFPAHPADRVRRLDVLRRTARPAGVRGRRRSSCRESCGTCAPRCAEPLSTRRRMVADTAVASRRGILYKRLARRFDSHFRHLCRASSAVAAANSGCHDALRVSRHCGAFVAVPRAVIREQPASRWRSPGLRAPARSRPARTTRIRSAPASKASLPRSTAARAAIRRAPSRCAATRRRRARQQGELDTHVGAGPRARAARAAASSCSAAESSRSNASTSTGRFRACAPISTASMSTCSVCGRRRRSRRAAPLRDGGAGAEQLRRAVRAPRRARPRLLRSAVRTRRERAAPSSDLANPGAQSGSCPHRSACAPATGSISRSPTRPTRHASATTRRPASACARPPR